MLPTLWVYMYCVHHTVICTNVHHTFTRTPYYVPYYVPYTFPISTPFQYQHFFLFHPSIWLQIETKGAKAWGAITVAMLAAADIWALYLLITIVASQCGTPTAGPIVINKQREFVTSLLFTYVVNVVVRVVGNQQHLACFFLYKRYMPLLHSHIPHLHSHIITPIHVHLLSPTLTHLLSHRFGVLLFSLALYMGLAIGLDREIHKNFSGQHVFARPDWAFAAAWLAGACLGGVTFVTAGAGVLCRCGVQVCCVCCVFVVYL